MRWAVDFWGTNKNKTIKVGLRQEFGGSPITKTIAIIPISGEAYTDEDFSNAHLIAAAPEMLEALKNIENDDKHMPRTAWNLIQKAIYRAEGGRS